MAYVDLADLKTFMGISDSGDDAFLTTLETSAEAYINRTANRIFEADSGSTRVFTPGIDTRGRFLFLDEDLAEITTVTNGDSIEVTSSEYVSYPGNRAQGGETVPIQKISILASSGKIWQHASTDPEFTISVLGKWGYSILVPENIQQITKRLTSWLYHQAQNGTDSDRPIVSPEGILLIPASVPNDVRDNLKPYMKGFG